MVIRSTKPTISIVTPSYNQGVFLEETIRSVLAQGPDVHEYFVYDGGSKDGSVEILKRFGDQLTHWESTPDGGQSDAIHKGFKRATGEYLFWLNSDDVLLPGAVAAIRAHLAKNPAWDVITSYCADIDKDSRVLYLKRAHFASRCWARWGVIPIYQPTCYFRRSLYFEVGGLDLALDYVMDTDLWLRFLEAGAQTGHIRRFLSAFRHHSASKNGIMPPEYASELAQLKSRYPQCYGGPLRTGMGLLASRLLRIADGSYAMHRLQTSKWRGRTLADFLAVRQ